MSFELSCAIHFETHQVTADGKSMNASIPVGSLIARGKLTLSKDLICDSLSTLIKLCISFTTVDQEWSLRFNFVFLKISYEYAFLCLYSCALPPNPQGSSIEKDEQLL